MVKDILIFGAGGQGREVLQLIRQINATGAQWKCLGWIDDGIAKGAEIAGLPVLGGLAELNAWPCPIAVVIAVAWPSTKAKIVTTIYNENCYYPTLIHPDVQLDPNEVTIGEGTIITQACRFTVNISIGRFALLNIGTIVTHDVSIGDYCGTMPSTNLSGAVTLKEGVYVGTGSQIIQGLTIGAYTIIGAGSVVIKDLPAHCTAVGTPARILK